MLPAEEAEELARIALAAMDSESGCLPLDYLQGHKDGLEWAAKLAEANHPETGDWLYDDPIELAKAIRKGPDMPPAQPVEDSEPDCNERQLFCSTDTARMKKVISVSAGSEATPLYRHAQQPVVPDDVLAALQKVARIRLDLNDFDGDRRGIADCLGDAEDALIEVVNRRAAMLQDGSSPVIPGAEQRIADAVELLKKAAPAMLADNGGPDGPLAGRLKSPVIPEGSVDMLRRWLAFGRGMQNAGSQLPHNLIAETESMLAATQQSPGSEPDTVPGKWIPVSERMPESNGMYFGWDGKRVLEVYCFFGGFSANQFIHGEITHWMPLPAAPQEPKP